MADGVRGRGAEPILSDLDILGGLKVDDDANSTSSEDDIPSEIAPVLVSQDLPRYSITVQDGINEKFCILAKQGATQKMKQMVEKGLAIPAWAAAATDDRSRQPRDITEETMRPHVNATSYWGRTALHWATLAGHLETVKFLLSVENVDVNKSDDEEETPLHSAAMRKLRDIVVVLIWSGADINAKCSHGDIPLDKLALDELEKDDDDNNVIQVLLRAHRKEGLLVGSAGEALAKALQFVSAEVEIRVRAEFPALSKEMAVVRGEDNEWKTTQVRVPVTGEAVSIQVHRLFASLDPTKFAHARTPIALRSYPDGEDVLHSVDVSSVRSFVVEYAVPALPPGQQGVLGSEYRQSGPRVIALRHAATTAGAVADRQSAITNAAILFHATKKACLAAGEQWLDPHFPHGPSCLWRRQHSPADAAVVAHPTEWKRASAIRPKDGQVILFDTDHDEVSQGGIGTCYFMGALISMSTVVDHAGHSPLRKLIVDYDSVTGIAAVTLFINGTWQFVLIDDLLPVNEHGVYLYGCCSKYHVLWPALLEKAYAKVHGSYENIDGGLEHLAMVDLCGGVPSELTLNLTSTGGAAREREISALWLELLEKFEDGMVMSSSVALSEDEEGGSEHALPSGLFAYHAYSITRMVEVAEPAREPVRLIKLRNPWGHGEWSGAWSDASPLWQSHPAAAEAAEHEDEDDGAFWMSAEDFAKNFSIVSLCRVFGNSWTQHLVHGVWDVSTAGDIYCGGSIFWERNPQYWLDVREETTVVVVLSQPDTKVYDGKDTYPVGIGFSVVDLRSASNSSAHGHLVKTENLDNVTYLGEQFPSYERTVTLELTLPSTTPEAPIIIVPYTDAPMQVMPYSLRVFSKGDVRLRDAMLTKKGVVTKMLGDPSRAYPDLYSEWFFSARANAVAQQSAYEQDVEALTEAAAHNAKLVEPAKRGSLHLGGFSGRYFSTLKTVDPRRPTRHDMATRMDEDDARVVAAELNINQNAMSFHKVAESMMGLAAGLVATGTSRGKEGPRVIDVRASTSAAPDRDVVIRSAAKARRERTVEETMARRGRTINARHGRAIAARRSMSVMPRRGKATARAAPEEQDSTEAEPQRMVTLFKQPSRGGDALSLATGMYDSPLVGGFGPGGPKSVAVPEGLVVRIFSMAARGGAMLELSAGQDLPYEWRGAVNSFEIRERAAPHGCRLGVCCAVPKGPLILRARAVGSPVDPNYYHRIDITLSAKEEEHLTQAGAAWGGQLWRIVTHLIADRLIPHLGKSYEGKMIMEMRAEPWMCSDSSYISSLDPARGRALDDTLPPRAEEEQETVDLSRATENLLSLEDDVPLFKQLAVASRGVEETLTGLVLLLDLEGSPLKYIEEFGAIIQQMSSFEPLGICNRDLTEMREFFRTHPPRDLLSLVSDLPLIPYIAKWVQRSWAAVSEVIEDGRMEKARLSAEAATTELQGCRQYLASLTEATVGAFLATASPQPSVLLVAQALCLLLNIPVPRANYLHALRSSYNAQSLLATLNSFDYDSLPRQLEALRTIMSNPQMSAKLVKNTPTEFLCLWLTKCYSYAFALDNHAFVPYESGALAEAAVTLTLLSPELFEQARALVHPPAVVMLGLAGVSLLLQRQDASWQGGVDLLENWSLFAENVANVNKNLQSVDLNALKSVMEAPAFDVRAAAQVSRLCRAIVEWVKAVGQTVAYDRVTKSGQVPLKTIAPPEVHPATPMIDLKDGAELLALWENHPIEVVFEAVILKANGVHCLLVERTLRSLILSVASVLGWIPESVIHITWNGVAITHDQQVSNLTDDAKLVVDGAVETPLGTVTVEDEHVPEQKHKEKRGKKKKGGRRKSIDGKEMEVPAKKREKEAPAKKRARPEQQDAQRSPLSSITRNQLSEMCALGNPPATIRLACSVVCAALGHTDTSWASARAVLRDAKFLQSMYDLKDISGKALAMRTQAIADGHTPERIALASGTCAQLWKFVLALPEKGG